MNKVMLIGNVGADPEVRYIDQGVAVASLRLATTERGYTLKNGTQVPDQTEWHNVVLWRQLAETVEKYVHKGDKLYIEGKLHTRSYDDRNGNKRYVVEIWADAMEMLSPKVHRNNVDRNRFSRTEGDVVFIAGQRRIASRNGLIGRIKDKRARIRRPVGRSNGQLHHDWIAGIVVNPDLDRFSAVRFHVAVANRQ